LFVRKRRNRWDDIFEKEEDDAIERSVRNFRDPTRRLDLEIETDARPYQYGLVGQYSPPLQSPTTDTRPTSTNTTFDPMMMVEPGGHLGYGNHVRGASLTQPMISPTASEYYNQGPSPLPTSRPSTSGSTVPLQGRPPSQAGRSPSGHSMHGRPLSAQSEFGAGPSRGRSQTSISSTGNYYSNAFPMQTNLYSDTLPMHVDRTGSASGSGSQSQVEEQRRQLQLANPSPDTPASSTVAVDQKLVGGQPRRTSTQPVVVHQDSGRVGGEPGLLPPPAYSA
jgi:hypothetical protein